MLNPMSSSWHSLFQKHRTIPCLRHCQAHHATVTAANRALTGGPPSEESPGPDAKLPGATGPSPSFPLPWHQTGQMKTWKSFAFWLSSKTCPPKKHSRPPLPHQNRKGATRPPPLVITVSTAVPVVDGPPDPLVPVGASVVSSTPGPGLVRVPFPVPSREGPEKTTRQHQRPLFANRKPTRLRHHLGDRPTPEIIAAQLARVARKDGHGRTGAAAADRHGLLVDARRRHARAADAGRRDGGRASRHEGWRFGGGKARRHGAGEDHCGDGRARG